MNDFERCNKVTGVYWLRTPLKNVEIRIRLKHHEGIKTLPKFDTYKNDSNNTMHHLESSKIEEHEFKWQEKVFSRHEIQRYSNLHNCISESDLLYHDMLVERNYQPKEIFSYIQRDHYLPPPLNKIKKSNVDIPSLSSCFEGLRLSNTYSTEETGSMGHLFKSEENVASEETWQAMHIIFDNSEYNEDSQLLLKQDITLLSLYYNLTQNYLIVSPDVNNLDLNPYQLDLGYDYAVDLSFEKEGRDEVLMLLKKLSKKWEKKHKQLVKFVMPPLGAKHFFVTIELLSAENFDLDNLYIEFHIKVPDGVKCSGALHGRTHMTKCYTHEDAKRWSFSHILEMHLETAVHMDSPPLKLFFEVISTDWWGRHRTEGYCYLPLSLEPGRYARQLSCSRPEELDSAAAESRRFFVGGCHLIKDLEVLANPQLQDANFKFTATGVLSLRWSTVTQVALPGFKPAPSHQGSHATAVLKGAEAALRHYRRARARLAAATKDLETVGDG